MQMTTTSVFTTSQISWVTATFPTHCQLFHMYLGLDLHALFSQTYLSAREFCFIAHKPVSFPLCYVNKNITQLSSRLKCLPCSFVSILIWCAVMGHIKSILSPQRFSVKLCPIDIHTRALIHAFNTCLLDYGNRVAVDITIFGLEPPVDQIKLYC